MLAPEGETNMHPVSRVVVVRPSAASRFTVALNPKLVFRPALTMALLLLAASVAVSAQGQGETSAAPPPVARPEAPDQSEALKNSKDPDLILRNFKTMYIDAHDAQFFGSDLMKSALHGSDGFDALNIHIVDDPSVADAVLIVSYSFAWDYPFELRHQNTTTVLVAGQGEGPFSGPLGAASVAGEFVNLVKKYRTAKDAKK
jgi:hypothetical protein